MTQKSIWDVVEQADGAAYREYGRRLRLTEKAALVFLVLEDRYFGGKDE